MGYVFEELIRKFNEALDENPGEHFTPREVIRLMVNLMPLSRPQGALKPGNVVRTVYDPCCGSGGMLTIAKEPISRSIRRPTSTCSARRSTRRPTRSASRTSTSSSRRPRRREHRVRQRRFARRPRRPHLRLPARQSALRQGLEPRQELVGPRPQRGRPRTGSRPACRGSATANSCSCSTCSAGCNPRRAAAGSASS